MIPALHFRFLEVFLPIEPVGCFPTQPILIVLASLVSFLDLWIPDVDSRKSIPARTAEQPPYGLEMGTKWEEGVLFLHVVPVSALDVGFHFQRSVAVQIEWLFGLE